MAAPANLVDAWASYLHDTAIATPHVPTPMQRRRDFMAGALAAQALLRSGTRPEALLAELSGFGRTIGTAAERADA